MQQTQSPQELSQQALQQLPQLTDDQIAAHFADFTNSHSIKLLARTTLKQFFHPGMITQLECYKLSFSLLPLLLDTVDPYFLKFCSRFLTPSDFEEVIDERNISHTCGYPLCSKIPTNNQGKYKIDFKSSHFSIIHPYLTKFCSKEHAQSATFYQKQLSDESVFLRKDVCYLPYGKCKYERQIALLEELQQMAATSNMSLDDVIVDFANMSFRGNNSTSSSGVEKNVGVGESNYIDGLSEQMKAFDFSIEERDPSKPSMDDLVGVEDGHEGNHRIIEGYQTVYNNV